jgi:cob(I)alamin adenosyltransferase
VSQTRSHTPCATPAPSRGQGYVHVYTGEGKGKTTAAFGLALRASGHGKRVFIGQFMKGSPSGETRALLDSPFVDVRQFGDAGLLQPEEVTQAHVLKAREGLERARRALTSDGYDVVILDEIDVAIWYDLLTQSDCLALLDDRPPHVELVLTGRWAPRAVLERADLVTEMREVKHYYRQGVPARAGIEF